MVNGQSHRVSWFRMFWGQTTALQAQYTELLTTLTCSILLYSIQLHRVLVNLRQEKKRFVVGNFGCDSLGVLLASVVCVCFYLFAYIEREPRDGHLSVL